METRLLIKEEELLAYLAGNVKPDPPRKNNSVSASKGQPSSLETPALPDPVLSTKVLLLEKDVSHLTEILEMERKVSMRLETERSVLEERVANLEAEIDSLREYKLRYHDEVDKGFLERLFSRPRLVKQLTGPS